MVVHKSVELLPNCFVIKIFLHPSASGPYGHAPPLVSNAAFFTKSASIASNFIACTCSGVSVSKISDCTSFPCECFCCNWLRVFLNFHLMEGPVLLVISQ